MRSQHDGQGQHEGPTAGRAVRRRQPAVPAPAPRHRSTIGNTSHITLTIVTASAPRPRTAPRPALRAGTTQPRAGGGSTIKNNLTARIHHQSSALSSRRARGCRSQVAPLRRSPGGLEPPAKRSMHVSQPGRSTTSSIHVSSAPTFRASLPRVDDTAPSVASQHRGGRRDRHGSTSAGTTAAACAWNLQSIKDDEPTLEDKHHRRGDNRRARTCSASVSNRTKTCSAPRFWLWLVHLFRILSVLTASVRFGDREGPDARHRANSVCTGS